MRLRTQLIIDDAVMQKIDEIAGEKNRRAAVVEAALLDYIAKHGDKAKAVDPTSKKTPPKKV
jgi:predicted transcriptional regulator